MCVTVAPAQLSGTMAYTYAIIDDRPENWHVTGYQNRARNQAPGPNCMLLHFPGNDIALVRGPEKTRSFMRDITAQLPHIEPESRSMLLGGTSRSARIETYGQYDVVLAENASDMLDALTEVDPRRRPAHTDSLAALMQWYQDSFPDYCFVLACFDGTVNPTHPIVVEYVPHNDDMLYVPGIDCHTGDIPTIGAEMRRDFTVAFGVEGVPQPFKVSYRDDCAKQPWAPNDVTGFRDNRPAGSNADYHLPLESVNFGYAGQELLELCA